MAGGYNYRRIVDNNGNVLGTVTSPMNTNSVSLSDVEGGKVTVGTTAVELTFSNTTKSIIISASQTNTGTIYIGKSNVASDGSNAIVFLEAGDSVTLEYNDGTNALYAAASVAAQTIFKGALIA